MDFLHRRPDRCGFGGKSEYEGVDMVDVTLDEDGKKFHPLIERTLEELEAAGAQSGEDRFLLPGIGSGRDGVAGPVGPTYHTMPLSEGGEQIPDTRPSEWDDGRRGGS